MTHIKREVYYICFTGKQSLNPIVSKGDFQEMAKRLIFSYSMLFFTLITTAFLSACSYTGATLEPDRLFELEQGESLDGKLETKDLIFIYRYNLKGEDLNLSGDIKFANRGVRKFKMRVHFVDAGGMILETAVASFSKGSKPGGVHIRIERKVPAATRSMAFSYSGEIIDRNNESMPIPFWRVP
jgi:hypothetical protein